MVIVPRTLTIRRKRAQLIQDLRQRTINLVHRLDDNLPLSFEFHRRRTVPLVQHASRCAHQCRPAWPLQHGKVQDGCDDGWNCWCYHGLCIRHRQHFPIRSWSQRDHEDAWPVYARIWCHLWLLHVYR